MTMDDALAFRNKILSCNPEKKGMTFFRPEDFPTSKVWKGIQSAQSIEKQHSVDSQRAKQLENQLSSLEKDVESHSVPYSEATHKYYELITEIDNLARGSVAFHKKYKKDLISKAYQGRTNAMTLWKKQLDQRTGDAVIVLDATINDKQLRASEVLPQFIDMMDTLAQEQQQYWRVLGGGDANEARHAYNKKMSHYYPAILARFSEEIKGQVQAGLLPTKDFIQKATSPTDVEQLRSIKANVRGGEGIDTVKAFLSDPATIQALAYVKEDTREGRDFHQATTSDVAKILSGIYLEAEQKEKNICRKAALDNCQKLTADIDSKYLDYSLLVDFSAPENNLTLRQLICAAKNKGHYKKFNGGGFFSSEISLELQSVTIYFRATKIDGETLQEVSESFNGPKAISVLFATEFKPLNGRKGPVANSALEMTMLMSSFGGLPVVPECAK